MDRLSMPTWTRLFVRRINMAEKLCPMLKKPCIKNDCAWWVRMMVKDGQGLKEMAACAIPLSVDIAIDSGKTLNRVQSAVESSRNVTNSAAVGIVRSLVNLGKKNKELEEKVGG